MIDRTKINTEEELGFTKVPAGGGGEGVGKGEESLGAGKEAVGMGRGVMVEVEPWGGLISHNNYI